MNIDFNLPYTQLAVQIHQFNVDKGWWDDWPDKTKRFETAMMLVISELAEAMEGCRKDLMDDKLPQHKMFDVELADAMIRLLDLAGAYGIDVEVYKTLIETQGLRDKTKPEQLWRVVRLIALSDFIVDNLHAISQGISMIHNVAEVNQIDLRLLIKEKMEYNNIRADHLRENREKLGGKQF